MSSDGQAVGGATTVEEARVHEYTVHLDSTFLGVHLDGTSLGVHLDSMCLGVHLDSTSLGVHLDSTF